MKVSFLAVLTAGLSFYFILLPQDTQLRYQDNQLYNQSKILQLTSLTNVDCHCKSLFTIGACDSDEIFKSIGANNDWTQTLKNIKEIRNGAPLSMIDNLHSLSKFLNSSYSENFNAKINRKTERLPYVPCRIHIYTPGEVAACLTERKSLTGRNFRIAFVGDSLVRNLMEQMVMNLREPLNLTVTGDSGKNLKTDFLNDKLKHSIPVQGDAIELQLHWAIELGRPVAKSAMSSTKQGAKDVLDKWSKLMREGKKNALPDIVYFNEGMWSLVSKQQLQSIITVLSDFRKFSGIFKELSTRSVMLLRTQTILKEYLAQKPLPNNALDLMAQIGWLTLNRTGVWFWDTPTPIYLKEYDECANLARTFNISEIPKNWGCADIQHPSKYSEQVTENMIWNLVCNRIMRIPNDHCCT